MDALALTDRDGLYGAVKFALACRPAGIRPMFGVDLAVAPLALDPSLPPGPARSGGSGPAGRPGRAAPARAVRSRPPSPSLGAVAPAAGACRGSPSSPGTARAGRRCAG